MNISDVKDGETIHIIEPFSPMHHVKEVFYKLPSGTFYVIFNGVKCYHIVKSGSKVFYTVMKVL